VLEAFEDLKTILRISDAPVIFSSKKCWKGASQIRCKISKRALKRNRNKHNTKEKFYQSP